MMAHNGWLVLQGLELFGLLRIGASESAEQQQWRLKENRELVPMRYFEVA